VGRGLKKLGRAAGPAASETSHANCRDSWGFYLNVPPSADLRNLHDHRNGIVARLGPQTTPVKVKIGGGGNSQKSKKSPWNVAPPTQKYGTKQQKLTKDISRLPNITPKPRVRSTRYSDLGWWELCRSLEKLKMSWDLGRKGSDSR